MDNISDLLYVCVINLVDLGGGDDIERQINQIDEIIYNGYSIIIIFDIYKEVAEIVENKKIYSFAYHENVLVLYNRSIIGKHIIPCYRSHVSKIMKVRCEGLNIITFFDSGTILEPDQLKKMLLGNKDTLLITSTCLNNPEILMKSKNPPCNGITVNHSEGLVNNFSLKQFLEPLSNYNFLTFDMTCKGVYKTSSKINNTPSIGDFDANDICEDGKRKSPFGKIMLKPIKNQKDFIRDIKSDEYRYEKKFLPVKRNLSESSKPFDFPRLKSNEYSVQINPNFSKSDTESPTNRKLTKITSFFNLRK